MQNSGTEYWTDEAGCGGLEVKTGLASLEARFQALDIRRVLEVLPASENIVNRGTVLYCRHHCGVDSSRLCLCLMRIVPKSLVGQNAESRTRLRMRQAFLGGKLRSDCQCNERREIAGNPASEDVA